MIEDSMGKRSFQEMKGDENKNKGGGVEPMVGPGDNMYEGSSLTRYDA